MMQTSGEAGERAVLLVGTRKGALLVSSDRSRRNWSVSDLHFPGGEVFHMAYDPRDGGTVLAAVNHMVWGPVIQRSDDLGDTWSDAEQQPRFAAGDGLTVSRIWHVEPGTAKPGVVYAGVEPAALFRSEDGGATWAEVEGLTGHPSREAWQPGLGGLCLHSIVPHPTDPQRMWVGISAVGVFGTEDAGQSWQTRNSGVRADFLSDPLPDFGQCPHKVLSHPTRPQLLYQQNHCGVYRSDSGGETWEDISQGLPSRFGFVLGLHSEDPDTLYVLPEDKALGHEVGGGSRYVTDASFRVYRSRNGGREWEPLTRGLPQKNAYLNVLREGMAIDSLDPCGIYVGTTTGEIFYSRDDGDSWELLADRLPPINSVDFALTG